MTMEPYAHVFPVNSAEIRFLKGSIPMGFLTKLFGTNMAKEIKRLDPIVRKIEALEEEYKGYTDAQLQAKTPRSESRAFSVMKEPCQTHGHRRFPVHAAAHGFGHTPTFEV